MAKSYNRGADVKLYIDSSSSYAGTWASATWVLINGVGDIKVDLGFDDVQVPERGADTGHLHGEKDWSISFDLYEDTGDAGSVALIAALFAGGSVHLAVANGAIATTGTKYVHGECLISGDLSGNRGEPHQYSLKAQKHANSANNLTRVTV